MYGTYTTLFVVVVFLLEITDFGFKNMNHQTAVHRRKNLCGLYTASISACLILLLSHELTVSFFWDRYQLAWAAFCTQTFGILIPAGCKQL